MDFRIFEAGKDFDIASIPNSEIGGKDVKLDAFDNEGRRIGFFKRQNIERKCYDSISEKICFELANNLGYSCAKNELSVDKEKHIGILTYLFTDEDKGISHQDFGRFFSIDKKNCKKKYNLDNIKNNLDKINKNLYKQFISLMLFDALIGMGDRHENNWGLLFAPNQETKISPFYDNSGSLLHNIGEETLVALSSDRARWLNHISRSKASIYDSEGNKRKHLDIIKELHNGYPNLVNDETKKLKNLNANSIRNILYKIPNKLMTGLRKDMLEEYLLKRKEAICKICG